MRGYDFEIRAKGVAQDDNQSKGYENNASADELDIEDMNFVHPVASDGERSSRVRSPRLALFTSFTHAGSSSDFP